MILKMIQKLFSAFFNTWLLLPGWLILIFVFAVGLIIFLLSKRLLKKGASLKNTNDTDIGADTKSKLRLLNALPGLLTAFGLFIVIGFGFGFHENDLNAFFEKWYDSFLSGIQLFITAIVLANILDYLKNDDKVNKKYTWFYIAIPFILYMCIELIKNTIVKGN